MAEWAVVLVPFIRSCLDTNMFNSILIRVKITIFYNCVLDIKDTFALSLSDFDMSGNLLHINKTYNRIRKRDVIDTPKTENSVRTIDIPNFLKERNVKRKCRNWSRKKKI